jgi:broad specificity phosphatase PhoE
LRIRYIMRVILVRHGQTEWNSRGIFRGLIDIELNECGERQARLTGEKLSSLEIESVYSSPLSRALKTARVIAGFHDIAVEVADELTDMNFGSWQGLSRDQVKDRYPDIFRTWEKSPHTVEIPEAETLSEVRKRIERGLKRILTNHGSSTVVMVSHGLIIKVMLCVVLGMDNSHFWKLRQDNSAVNIFEYAEEGTKLFLMNDTAHLQPVDEVIESMKNLEDPLG